MNPALGSVIALVFIVIVINFIMLYIRLKRDLPRKSGKKALEEEEAMLLRTNEIQRRLTLENDAAERFLEHRAKTWELYEQVRRNAAEAKAGAVDVAEAKYVADDTEHSIPADTEHSVPADTEHSVTADTDQF